MNNFVPKLIHLHLAGDHVASCLANLRLTHFTALTDFSITFRLYTRDTNATVSVKEMEHFLANVLRDIHRTSLRRIRIAVEGKPRHSYVLNQVNLLRVVKWIRRSPNVRVFELFGNHRSDVGRIVTHLKRKLPNLKRLQIGDQEICLRA